MTNADALAALAETALASGPKELSGGERYMVVVHADADALAAPDRGKAAIEDGPAPSFETLRRLACDSSLVPMIERDGHPLSVGRKSRAIPPAIRRALLARDRGCRFPGCENRRFTEAHHIEHWADGGKTCLSNLCLLCRRHHDYLHEGGYKLTRDVNGALHFFHPGGWEILPSPALIGQSGGRSGCMPRGDRGLRARSRRARLSIDPGTAWTGSGERMNLDLCMLAVSAAKERSKPLAP